FLTSLAWQQSVSLIDIDGNLAQTTIYDRYNGYNARHACSALAASDSGFALAYSSATGLEVRLFDASSDYASRDPIVLPATDQSTNVAMTFDGTRYVVTFMDQDPSDSSRWLAPSYFVALDGTVTIASSNVLADTFMS